MLKTHRLTAGLEYRDYFLQEQMNFDADPFASRLDDKRSTRVWAIYLQDEFEIAKGLILNAGIRYDRYSTFGGTTNPRVALIYNPRPKTTLKLLYGKAFRAPNVYEMFYTDGGITQKTNSNLRPEKIETVEGVVEQSIGDHLRFLAAGYSYKIADLITQETDPADTLLVYRNETAVRARGVETGLNGRWGNGLEGRVGYTYQETEDERGRRLVNSPRHLVKLNLIAPLLAEKVFAGGETQYVSERTSLQGDAARAYYVVNLTLFGRDLVKGLDGSASVYNLFDYRYGDPTGNKLPEDILPQDGRSFRAKLTYRF
jgi:iron complex outermembrane receptor protein